MWKFLAVVAAFAIFQTASGPPQIHYNIVTDGGAACNGDFQKITRSITTNDGNTNLQVSVDTFTSGDVGKRIIVPGAAFAGGTISTTITAFVNAQNVTMGQIAQTNLSGVSTDITYGTDDAPKFGAFNTWAVANQGVDNQVVLTVPTGAICWFGSRWANPLVISFGTYWAAGINNLIVEGTGATLTSIDGSGFQLGGDGMCFIGIASANGCSARIQTVSAGSSTVTLTASSLSSGYISRFTVGRWIMIGGLDPQGQFNQAYGDPANNRYFEWRKITAVDGSTGVITLDRPLDSDYLSTWPLYNAGDNFHSDNGGPATIWAVGSTGNTWGITAEYRGLTINQGGQTYGKGKSVTYRNVTFGGTNGAIPTENESWSAINVNYGAFTTLETDKLVGTMLFDNVNLHRLYNQSTATHLFVMRNSTITNAVFGTPTRTEITDSTMTLFRPGATGYGGSSSTVCVRCNVADFQLDGGVLVPSGSTSPFVMSMTGGLISFLNTDVYGEYPMTAVMTPPNGNIYMGGGGYTSLGLLNVQSMSQDATNTYVQTNEAGGFPGITVTGLRTHPSPQWTCDDCSGDADIVRTNIQNGATAAAPLGSYARQAYAPTSAQGELGPVFVRGKLVSLTIDVTQAYTGTGSASLNATARFNNLGTVKQSDWTNWAWGPVINLKQAGVRVITPGGVTCDGAPGACSGDTINSTNGFPPEAVWISNVFNPYMGSSFSGGVNPQFTITMQTDQGVVP